jgi:hypothetical protein
LQCSPRCGGLVAGEGMRRRAMLYLPLEIDVSKCLPFGVADDEAPPIQLGVGLVDRPSGGKRRERSRGQITRLGRQPLADDASAPNEQNTRHLTLPPWLPQLRRNSRGPQG